MDRILLGNNAVGGTDDSTSGFWVSKPGVNVIAYAANSYYAGTGAGPEGLQADGSVLPIYGFNENFNFTGSNTYTYDWVGRGEKIPIEQSKISTTADGTILFNCNESTGDPFFIHVMNTNPQYAGDGYNGYYREHSVDTSFNGNNYPILEFRVRRPQKSDGTHWQTTDFDTVHAHIFEIFFATSNATNDHRSLFKSVGVGRSAALDSGAGWHTVFGTSGEWVSIEYDFENGTYKWERDGGTTGSSNLTGTYDEWASNTSVHAIRFDPFNRVGSITYPLHTRPEADLEIDYIRAKKRGIPINFGTSLDDNFTFSSDWLETGIVHQTGMIALGNEFAYANGFAKSSGTSHPGSQSGRVEFNKLPYIPVVLFQRYDDRNTDLPVSFPGGDKEFSVAHGDLSYDSQVWNPLTRQYQKSSNTSYASEYRTFAYARSGYDHFDLTSRNAIARDGYEWLFNYTPQEPYIEIYKGGNYDPESENPESFVMYPQVQQMKEETERQSGNKMESLRRYKPTRSPYMGIDFPIKGRNIDPSFPVVGDKWYITPAFNNTLTAGDDLNRNYGLADDINPGIPAAGVFQTEVWGEADSFISPEYAGYGTESETNAAQHRDYLHAGAYTTEILITPYDLTSNPPKASVFDNFPIGSAPPYGYQAKGEYANTMPQHNGTDGIYIPALGTAQDWAVHPQSFYGVLTAGVRENLGLTTSSALSTPAGIVPGLVPNQHRHLGGSRDDNVTNNADMVLLEPAQLQYENMFYDTGWFHDDASSGAAFAVGAMNPGVLGVRRGRIITTDNIPAEGWDQNEGRGAPWPPEINATAFSATGTIGALNYLGTDKALDYSARDYTTGKLGYFANYTGTDKGNCLPTFDWANKFGDWNVPQFNNFYQYDPDVGAGSYVPFKDSIGTSWTEKNTKFLDDSMWLGYANNRFEYKGDIWHPQSPTKTYDELSGVFGYGGMIKNQGDWAHGAGFGFLYGDDLNHNARHPYYNHIWPHEGMTGIHAISRYDTSPDAGISDWASVGSNDPSAVYQRSPFHPHMQFRNRYGYAPGNMYDEWAEENSGVPTGPEFGDFGLSVEAPNIKFSGSKYYYETTSAIDLEKNKNIASKDFSSEIGFCGPGGAFLWSAPHDYGRMGAVSTSFTPERTPSTLHTNRYTADLFIQRIMPPSIFWKRPAEVGRIASNSLDRSLPPLTNFDLINGKTIPSPKAGGRIDPHEAAADTFQGYQRYPYVDRPDFMGVFYNNFTTPWDGLRLDTKRRNSSRLGFGGDPETKQRYPHHDLAVNKIPHDTGLFYRDEFEYGTGMDALEQHHYFAKPDWDVSSLGPGPTSTLRVLTAHDPGVIDNGSKWIPDMAIYGRYPFSAPSSGNEDSFEFNVSLDPRTFYGEDISEYPGRAHSFDRDPTWTEPQTGYNGHKDSFVVSRWYTYPGATFSYDVSNFSGPAHYDAWYKNDQTEEVQDYKRRDYPQLYEGGWGNYGYFPTQEQLDQGKGATRLFPDPHISTDETNLISPPENDYYRDYYTFEHDDLNYKSTNFSILGGYGSHPYNCPVISGTEFAMPGLGPYWDGSSPPQHLNEGNYNTSISGGPNMIFKKTAITQIERSDGADFPINKHFETPLVDAGVSSTLRPWPIRAYLAPNHKHRDKQVSRTFGIPNEIAGDYYASSRRHNERYGHPDVVISAGDLHKDVFLDMVGTAAPTSSTDKTKWRPSIEVNSYLDKYEQKIHSKEGWYPVPFTEKTQDPTNSNTRNKYHTYYHPDFVGGANDRKNLERQLPSNRKEMPIQVLTEAEWDAFSSTDYTQFPYPDEKLRAYLYRHGIDLDKLLPGEPIPITADPYFAGMAFQGTNASTGAFNAHRFEFVVKKTKKHINHFRQSYEYNYPGRFPHRADTLRPIGYGLVTNHYGFDDFASPPPAAHSYFDGRQLGGGHAFLKHKLETYVKEYRTTDEKLWQVYYDSGAITNEHINYGSFSEYGFHPVNLDSLANSWFGATSTWKSRFYKDSGDVMQEHSINKPETGWSSFETAYDREIFNDPAATANGTRPVLVRTNHAVDYGASENLTYSQRNNIESAQTGSAHYLKATSTSISRHGRDSMVDGIIGAVEVANTYSADYKATYWDGASGSYKNWITNGAGEPNTTPKNTYYALAHKKLRYRPAKSQGASPETQMYSAYFGAPWNRWTDATPFFAGFNSVYTSTGNHWEGDILPGMCKADNALTNWGTVDLSKFDETKLGYRWHNDAWFDNDRAGLARSIIWSPSNANTFFSEGTPTPAISDGGRTIPAGRKGMGRDYFGYHEDRTQTSSYSKRWNKYRITPHQKGGTYDGFKLHERPEFQPVSGDGRYFGGVGGVDNWGGTSYNTWGPGMTVSPAVWDLKWSGIQHPFRVSPSVEEDSDTFFNATSIENQTSYIGGAPNVRVLIGDNGGTFKYSDGTAVSGTGYDDANTWSETPRNYDWAIGGNQIQCNHWDRALKIKDLEYTDGSSGRVIQHANNGVQPTTSLKVKALYAATPGYGTHAFVLEENTVIDSVSKLGWRGPVESGQGLAGYGDTLILKNTPSGTEYELKIVDDNGEVGGLALVDGIRVQSLRDNNEFRPILLIANTAINIPASDMETPTSPSTIEQHPQLVLYNKTLAEDPSRHPANAFKANTTYHFQYMYDETKINPPMYKYWVLRIPAGLDAYNGESLL